MTLPYLLRKEFLQIRRNPFLPKLIFIFPIMVMCVMPWVMNMEVKNIKVDVVDNDRSTLSQQLVHRIEQSSYFIFGGQKASYSDALSEVEQGRADVVLVIPQHYGRDMHRGQLPQVLIAANAADAMKGSMGSNYLQRIVVQNLPIKASMDIDIAVMNLYNREMNYKTFMIPALLGILMMMLGGFLPALNIVAEKESGTIEQINVTPISKITFILAKLIPYWIIAMVVLTLALLLAWAVYGITCQGPLWLLYLVAFLLALIFSGLGLMISNYSDTMQQAMLMMWFVVVIIMLMSGLFTPVSSMPDWAQRLTIVNPMRYFIDAARTIFNRAGNFSAVRTQVLVLAGIAVVMDLWAVISYRKNH